MEVMSSEERLRPRGLSSLERRRLRGELLVLYSFLRRGSGEGGADLFSLGSSDRIRGNGSKLCEGGLDWTLGSISFSHLDNGADGSPRAALEGAGTRCSFLRSL